jgi:hypothetical protein
LSVAQPKIAPDLAGDLDQVRTTAEANSWTKFPLPAIVALSVGLVAQVSRLFARWWKSRVRSRVRGVAERLDRCSAAGEPVLPDCVIPWIDETDLIGIEIPVSRAS